ncbi:NAD(P)-dependent alcohol dehydrogenase [Paenibacillus sp. XY044]|uniref:zinc-dependent alcohol dehydrogenase family protein n=1 Tax=Paenibacillus sp. XY044 TaxID=2026089 RepID=UPI000B98BDE2|nr:NAD(P)-dependent alcohol dehydrogenase [Paenibacillus sp. XY044]OZB93686.1 NAD(P)-dependent alcohol dehydrogenase [Paenibacillus sp. XY044]
MRSYHVKNGKGLESLVVTERDIPTPGSHEVLLRVRATSFNYRDGLIMSGAYPLPVKEPSVIPLADGTGEVVAVGSGVTRAQPGGRVVVNSLVHWIEGPFIGWEEHGTQFSGSLDGFLSEYIVVSEEVVLPIPEHLTYEEAATLPVSALTAWNALTGFRQPTEEDTVLALGSGSVSLFAIQFAKSFGARVIATTTNEDKIDRLAALGAEVIHSRTTSNWHETVRDMTNGRGAQMIIENTNPGTLEQSIHAAAISGLVSVVGWIPSSVKTMDISAFYFNMVTLRPIMTGSRNQFEEMNQFIAEHRIKPVIDRIFPFEEAKEAYDYYMNSRSFGKVVIHMD